MPFLHSVYSVHCVFSILLAHAVSPLPPRRLPDARVGRTGRLATDGHAFSFFTREMARLAPPLVDLLQAHEQARAGELDCNFSSSAVAT